MGKSQETFNKSEKEKKRLKKKKAKQQKREERRTAKSEEGGLNNQMAYVDENGHLTDTPPDLTKKKKINAKNIEIGVPKRENDRTSSIRSGVVEFFNKSKGFGFIKELETNDKYFVHVNGLTEEIDENDKVTFELERGLKGMNAVDVKKV